MENGEIRNEARRAQMSRRRGCDGFFARVGGALADFDLQFASNGVVGCRGLGGACDEVGHEAYGRHISIPTLRAHGPAEANWIRMNESET
jgi:hypothetical protein